MGSIPRTIREQVTSQIRDDLVAGNFPAGSTLRETEFAERFGVSRGPIRDALLQLSQEGFLAYQANRGVTVRHPPDPDDREFITSLRKQFETHVIKKGIAKLSEDSITKIEAALDNLKSACDSGDVAAIASCDMAFHESVLVGCGGEDLVPAWRQLCSRMLLTYTRLNDYQAGLSRACARFSRRFRPRKSRRRSPRSKTNIK